MRLNLAALLRRRRGDRYKPPSAFRRLVRRLPLPGPFPSAVLLVIGFVFGVVLWLWMASGESANGDDGVAQVVTVPVAGGAPPAPTPPPTKVVATPPTEKKPPEKAAAEGHSAPPAKPPPQPTPVAEAPPRPTQTAGPGPGAEEAFPLAKAPAIGLTEESRNGLLPAIAPDGRQPWQIYARPYNAAGDKRARIALVIGRMGVAGAATGLALQRLPPGVTLAFVPLSERLEGWVEAARGQGHEALLSVPMEPLTYPHDDPGPNTLLLSLDTAHNMDRLEWALGRFSGYIGVTSPTGTRFGADPSAMKAVLETVKKRGLMFLDARTAPGSVGDTIAAELGVTRARVDRLIDRDPSRAAIDAELRALEEIALKDGVAIGMGEPYPTTLERIAKWVPLLSDKKIVLVPLSSVANLQKPSDPPPPPKPEGQGHDHH